MRYFLTSFLLAFSFQLLEAQTLQTDSLYAPSLGRIKKFMTLLPEGYTPAKKYPVLYLLHGWSGNHTDWSTKAALKRHTSTYPLIVVMPDGENSWYINSLTDSSARFENFLTGDLRVKIQTLYSVDTSKQAIAGLSMGGYGSVMLALRHPSLFRFAGSLSGVLNAPSLVEARSLTKSPIVPSMQKAFGDAPSASNGLSAKREKIDAFKLYKAVPREAFPYLYVAMGADDKSLVQSNRDFTDSLRAINADYEYHETQGGHDWTYWDTSLPPLLRRLREVLKF